MFYVKFRQKSSTLLNGSSSTLLVLRHLYIILKNQQIGTMQAVKFKLEIWQSRVVQRFYKHIMQVSFETSVVKGQLELIRQRLEDPPTYPYQLTFPLPLSPCTLFPTSLHTVFSYWLLTFSVLLTAALLPNGMMPFNNVADWLYMYVHVLHSCIGFAMLFFQHVCQCFRLVVFAPMRAFY